MRAKRAIVIGAGVVGTLTAEALWEHGYDVTVLEKNPMAGLGTSFANAGQLCGPFCLPFASPGFFTGFLKKSLAGKGVGLRFTDALKHIPWLIHFIHNSNSSRYTENSEAMLRLAYESIGSLEAVRARHS